MRFVLLGMICATLIGLSSCRFGNYQQNAPGGPGTQAGYYETLITPNITMCATLPSVGASGTTTKCPIEAATHVDPLISYVITNPVELQYSSTTGIFDLAPNPQVVSGTPFLTLPLLSDNQGNLAYQGPVASFIPMQSHPGCQLTLSISENGTYSSGGTYNSGSSLPITGRISLSLIWEYVPSGADCALISSCYSGANDASGAPVCSQQDQLAVKQFYGPFVDTGILAVSDLSNVQKLEYQVSFD